MEYGYVYILINNSLNGMIKIGSTVINAQERAKQLSANTSVPTPFVVAYEIYVPDYREFEKKIHNQLSDFRINPNREFFRYPLYKAIMLIEDLKNISFDTLHDRYEAMEVLPQLQTRYKEKLKPSISSVRIFQTNDRVYLEYTEDEYIADYLKDQHITRIDLGFIVETIDEKMFKADRPVSTNVELLLGLDDYGLGMCVGEIFIDDGEGFCITKQDNV